MRLSPANVAAVAFVELHPLRGYRPAMHSDIVDLRSFYASTLGRLAEHSITMALSSVWASVPNERLVGLGYTLPWLERFGADAERVFAFMPAAQGAVVWPATGPTSTALVFEEDLPLVDASVDRMLLVHSLEHTENPRETLNEIWRVLSPAGHVVIVVPNRRGMWARFEHTPFGTGRPYSRGQLAELLREANFTPAAWSDGLHFPPSPRRFMMRFHNMLERGGRRFWPIFSGVLVVAAQKRLYQGVPAAQRASRRVFVPALSPQGATGLGRVGTRSVRHGADPA
jgi:SAM-dependent methyltransferase